MKWSDIATLFGLAAIWGGSYLFMRLGAGEFGAVPMAALRAAGAGVILLPILIYQGGMREMLVHWRGMLVVGLVNFALPFVLFGWAAQQLPAGSLALFTGATPCSAPPSGGSGYANVSTGCAWRAFASVFLACYGWSGTHWPGWHAPIHGRAAPACWRPCCTACRAITPSAPWTACRRWQLLLAARAQQH